MAPQSAKCSAEARPIPDAAPLTTTTPDSWFIPVSSPGFLGLASSCAIMPIATNESTSPSRHSRESGNPGRQASPMTLDSRFRARGCTCLVGRRRSFLPPPPAGRQARALRGEGRGYGVDTSFAAPRAKKREKSPQIRDFLALHSYRPHYSTPVGQAIDRTLLFEMCPCHRGRGGGGRILNSAIDTAETHRGPRTRTPPPTLTLPRKGGGDTKGRGDAGRGCGGTRFTI